MYVLIKFELEAKTLSLIQIVYGNDSTYSMEVARNINIKHIMIQAHMKSQSLLFILEEHEVFVS